MPRIHYPTYLCVVALLVSGPTVRAQDGVTECSIAAITKCLGTDFSRFLEDPETLNKALSSLTSLPGLKNALGDVSLQFKTFYSEDSAVTALGLGYSYEKDIVRTSFDASGPNYSAFNFFVEAEGNVSFNGDVNPRDFLDTELSFSLARSRGGVGRRSTAAEAAQFAMDVANLALEDDRATYDEAAKNLVQTIRDRLTNQFYLEVALSGSLESDQAFDHTQYVVDAELGLDLKAWNKNATLARLNIFDWPFAVMRYLTGVDKELSPRGSNIPTALIGIGVVDPSDNPVRESLGELDPYWRIMFETAFKSLVMETTETSIFFQSDFRFYKELGASSAIKDANRDDFAYFVAALAASNGLYFSYSTGKLPFDAENDQVYELGFKMNF
ncbi:MAG: hypothetical protein HKM89_08940 [Gemmatimonadales bacterium]|nr:hypothetical protein [Gemmatimonadales bacterium]